MAEPRAVTPITRRRYTKAQAAQFWAQQDALWPETRRRAEYARTVLDGENKAPVPEEIQLGRDVFQQRLPVSTTVPMHTLNLVTSKRPELKRNPLAVGLTAQQVSTKVENVSNALAETLFAWEHAMGMVLNEGMAFVAVTPQLGAYKDAPDLYESDGETIRTEYRRDVTGRAPYDRGYAEDHLDHRESRKAYDAHVTDYRANHLPLAVDVYSRTEAVPIGLHWVGKELKLTGMVARRQFAVSDLIDEYGFIWDGMPDPVKLAEDPGAEVALIETWMCDRDGPWVAYAIEGKETRRRRVSDDGEELVDAVIDLKTAYGFTELPVTCAFGWHFPRRDLDKSPVPFPWVFGPNWATMDTIISAITYRMWAFAFLGPLVELSENDTVIARLENDLLQEFKLEPMKAKTVPGRVQWPMAPNVGSDAWEVVRTMLQVNEMEQTPVAARGGPGASSGFDRALSQKQALDALGQVMEAGLALYRFVGSKLLEAYCHVSRMREEPVSVYYNLPNPQAGVGSATRSVISISPDMVGGNYFLHAEYPRKPGENIAQVQQWFEIFKGGGMDWFEFRELGFGDQAPDVSLARKVAWEYLQSPEGQMELKLGIAEYTKDKRMKEILELAAGGKTNQRGIPTALGQGTNPPASLMALGNPAASALGGIVNGPLAGAQQAVPVGAGEVL